MAAISALHRRARLHFCVLEEKRGLNEKRTMILAEISPDVEVSAKGREAELLDEARSLIDQLDVIGAELRELVSAVRLVRRASGRVDDPVRSVTVLDVIDAVASKDSLINPRRIRVPTH